MANDWLKGLIAKRFQERYQPKTMSFRDIPGEGPAPKPPPGPPPRPEPPQFIPDDIFKPPVYGPEPDPGPGYGPWEKPPPFDPWRPPRQPKRKPRRIIEDIFLPPVYGPEPKPPVFGPQQKPPPFFRQEPPEPRRIPYVPRLPLPAPRDLPPIEAEPALPPPPPPSMPTQITERPRTYLPMPGVKEDVAQPFTPDVLSQAIGGMDQRVEKLRNERRLMDAYAQRTAAERTPQMPESPLDIRGRYEYTKQMLEKQAATGAPSPQDYQMSKIYGNPAEWKPTWDSWWRREFAPKIIGAMDVLNVADELATATLTTPKGIIKEAGEDVQKREFMKDPEAMLARWEGLGVEPPQWAIDYVEKGIEPDTTPPRPLTFKETMERYTEEYPPTTRVVMEVMNPLMWGVEGPRFGAGNPDETIKIAKAKHTGATLSTSIEAKQAFWKWFDEKSKLFETTPETKAIIEAQDAVFSVQANLEEFTFGETGTLITADDISKRIDDIRRGDVPVKGPAAEEAKDALQYIDVDSFRSVSEARKIAEQYGGEPVVNLLSFNDELREEVLKRKLIDQGLLKPGEPLSAMHIDYLDKFNNTMREVESFFWLSRGGFVVRNAANNVGTLAVDGLSPMGKSAEHMKYVSDTFGLGNDVVNYAEEMGRSWGIRDNFLYNIPIIGPLNKKIMEVAWGESKLGEAGIRNRALVDAAEKTWNTLWKNGPRKLNTRDPKIEMFPGAPDFLNPEIRSIVEREAREMTNLNAFEEKLRKILGGETRSVTEVLPPDHPFGVDELVKLQKVVDEGDVDGLINLWADDMRKHDAAQLADPSPVIAKDFEMGLGEAFERTGALVGTDTEMMDMMMKHVHDTQKVLDDLYSVLTELPTNPDTARAAAYALDVMHAERMKTYRMAEELLRDTRVDVYQRGVEAGPRWQKYRSDINALHQSRIQEYSAKTDELIGLLRKIAEGDTNVLPPGAGLDVAKRMEQRQKDFLDWYEKEVLAQDPRLDMGFREQVMSNRIDRMRAEQQAWKSVVQAAQEGNPQAFNWFRAAQSEVDRINARAAAFVNFMRDRWLKEGGAELVRKEASKVWNAATKDSERAYGELRLSLTDGQRPDFFKADVDYATNDIINKTFTADDIIKLANDAGISTATKKGVPKDQHLINVINKAIREENARRKALHDAEIAQKIDEFNPGASPEEMGLSFTPIPELPSGGNIKETLANLTDDQLEITVNELLRRAAEREGREFIPIDMKNLKDVTSKGLDEGRDALPPQTQKVLDEMGVRVGDAMPEATPPTVGAAARSSHYEKNEYFLRIFDMMQEGTRPWIPASQLDDMVKQIVDFYKEPFLQAKAIVAPVSKQLVDFSMLDYSKRRRVDTLLELFFPYQYWKTRSSWNWLQRIVNRPQFLYATKNLQDLVASQTEGDISTPKRMLGKVGLRQSELEKMIKNATGMDVDLSWMFSDEFAPEWWVTNPMNLFNPLGELGPQFDYNDPSQANNWLQKLIVWSRILGFGPHAYVSAVQEKIMGEQPSKVKDYIPQLELVSTASNQMRDVLPFDVPPGGFMFGPNWGRWDMHRVKRSIINLAEEELGIPPTEDGTYRTLQDIELALLERGEVDNSKIIPFARVLDMVKRWEKGEISDEELQMLLEDPIYKAAANRAGLERGIPFITSFLTGIGVTPISKGEKAVLAERALAESKKYNPETGEGSREEYLAVKDMAPATKLSMDKDYMQYTFMARKQELDQVNKEYRQRLSDLIKKEPANFWKQDDLRDEWRAKVSEIYQRWSDDQDELRKDKRLWSIYGARPEEVIKIRKNQILNEIARTRPKKNQFYENPEGQTKEEKGQFDFEAYMEAMDKWYESIPDVVKANDIIQKALNDLRENGYITDPHDARAFMTDINNPDTVREYLEREIWDITPLDGLVNVLKDIHFGRSREREAAYIAAGFGPEVIDANKKYVKEIELRFNKDAQEKGYKNIWKAIKAYWNAVEGHFGSDIIDKQNAYYNEIDKRFGENIFDLQSQYFKYPKGSRARKQFLKKHPQLLQYWKQKDAIRAKYPGLTEYWKYKDALQEQYGITNYMRWNRPLKEKYGVTEFRRAKHDIDAQFPGLQESNATDYIAKVLERYPWFRDVGWDEKLLWQIYNEVALIPDSDTVWMIEEAYERGVPLSQVQLEESILDFVEGQPLPEVDEQGGGGSGGGGYEGRGRRRYGSRYYRGRYYGRRGRSYYRRRYYGGGGGGGSKTMYRPRVPSFVPGGVKRRERVYVS